MADNNTMETQKKVYLIENLGCAHCAAKMEEKISALSQVESATITYTTKQLRITAANPDALIPEIERICQSIESGVHVVPYKKQHKHEHHEHHEHCDCGHDHGHEHHHHEHEHGHCDCEHEHSHEHHHHEHHEHHGHEHDHEHDHCDCGHEHNHEHHHHEHHEHCGCGHEHAGGLDLKKFTVPFFIICAVLIIAGEIYHEATEKALPWPIVIVFLIIYILQGYKVLLAAAKGIIKGHVFDENFLMSIATIGALIIGKFGEAAGVMLFFQIGEYFEHRAVERSRSQIMSAIDMRPEVVLRVAKHDVTETIPAEDAQIGDIVLIRPGDRIPLDGTIVDGESRIDTSALTGEPVPVSVKSGSNVLSGCVNMSGTLKMRVGKTLDESMVTRILESVENAAANKPVLDRFITRFSHYYTPIVILLAVAVAVIPPLVLQQSFSHWIYTALTFLVMSCPCALVLSVPLAFFSGIGAGSKKGILFKGGASMEALSKIKAVVMDKTGTLTKGEFKVNHVHVVDKAYSESQLLLLAANCEMTSTHPIAHSILEEAAHIGLTPEMPDTIEEIAGHGICATMNGKTYLCGNEKLMSSNNIVISEAHTDEAGTQVHIACDGLHLGTIIISDTLKADAKDGVLALKKMGLSTAILTGDSEHSAQVVADHTGIDEVHAKLLPNDKLTRLSDIRQRKGAVMFVGDGINDAPVLAGADVGAAMGSGADSAIEAADVVFMHSDVASIAGAIKLAKSSYNIAMQNVVFALIIKAIVMILGFLGIASMWLAVFADTGVAILCILNAIKILYRKRV